MFGKYYEDFKDGEPMYHETTKTVTESDNNLFCLLTMNHHPIHLDTEYAEESRYGRILVVGTYVISLVVGISVADVSGKAIANLEYNNIKHENPVFVGDTIHAKTHVISMRLSKTNKKQGIVRVMTRAFNQRHKLILTLERTILVPVRGAK